MLEDESAPPALPAAQEPDARQVVLADLGEAPTKQPEFVREWDG